jgi:hypothetical protein
MEEDGYATQVYRRGGAVVTVTGIPAVRVCPRCHDAVLEWEIAQQVEDLVTPLFAWRENHSLPAPVVTVVFPAREEVS